MREWKLYQVLEESTVNVPRSEAIEKIVLDYESEVNKLLEKLGVNLIFDLRRENKTSNRATLKAKKVCEEIDE